MAMATIEIVVVENGDVALAVCEQDCDTPSLFADLIHDWEYDSATGVKVDWNAGGLR